MLFTKNDFDAIISGDKDRIEKVDVKFRNLVKKISQKLDYSYGFYKYNDRYSGYTSKSKSKDVFINWQINSEDLSIEFMITKKKLITKFLSNTSLKELQEIKKFGDTEIATWDKKKKVIKLYPEYIDQKSVTFLLNKIKRLDKPILKIRKIYSRDNELLKNIDTEAMKSIKQLEIFFKYF